MSSTGIHQRTFALVMALLFLATSVAGVALVIWQIDQDNKQSAVIEQLNNQTKPIQNCVGQVSGVEVLEAPQVYIPPTDVTQLEVTDLVVGEGAEAKSGDCITAKYYGTLATTGEMFDENFTSDTAFKFQLGAGSVITGWDQGLVGMRVGGTRQLVIPSDLAYGDQANGSIPADSDLVFVVKLLDAQGSEATDAE